MLVVSGVLYIGKPGSKAASELRQSKRNVVRSEKVNRTSLRRPVIAEFARIPSRISIAPNILLRPARSNQNRIPQLGLLVCLGMICGGPSRVSRPYLL